MSSNPGFPALERLGQNVLQQRYFCKAKYAIQPNGEEVLLSIEWADQPIFGHGGGGAKREKMETESEDTANENHEQYVERSVNRAKVRCFDYIMCNPSLRCFATLTIDAEKCSRTDYDEIYRHLRAWLSNAVSRLGLCYVLCPEHHKDGEAIHFHMLCNDVLPVVSALTPGGYQRMRKGKPIYNIPSWRLGFSTMQYIDPEKEDREAVAKYMFKYMGKAAGEKIGGRYFFHGGKLAEPVERYADEISAFYEGVPKYLTEREIPGVCKYTKAYYR